MPADRMSRFIEHFEDEQEPLLARRRPRGLAITNIDVSKPTDKQNINYLKRISLDQNPLQSPSSSKQSKLSLQIPASEGRQAEYVRTIPHTSNPILEDGVVAHGKFDKSSPKSREACREEWIQALQWSGDRGWNDYLHWHEHHPNDRPFKSFDRCHCDFERSRKKQERAYKSYWDGIQEERQANQKEEVERTFIDNRENVEFRCDTAEVMAKLEFEADVTSDEDEPFSCYTPSPLTGPQNIDPANARPSYGNTFEEQAQRHAFDITEMKKRVNTIRQRAADVANRKTRDEEAAISAAESEEQQGLLRSPRRPRVEEESRSEEWSTCGKIVLAVVGLVAFVDFWLLARELFLNNLS